MDALRNVSLMIGGQEFSDFIEIDSIDATRFEHGPASFACDLPLEDQWSAVSPLLVNDALFEFRIDGTMIWDGKVARLIREGGEAPTLRIEGRGAWPTLGDFEGYRKGFIETRPEQFAQVAQGAFYDNRLQTGDASLDTDGQVLLCVPKGSEVSNYATAEAALWILDGMASSATIQRVVLDVLTRGDSWMSSARDVAIRNDLYGSDVTSKKALVVSGSPSDATLDVTLTSGERGRCLYLVMMSPSSAGTLTQDGYIQVRAFRLYIDRTTEPTIDSAILEIASECGYSADAGCATVGSARYALMYDGPGTPQEAISYIASLHSLPVVHRFTDGLKLLVKPRPTAPDGTSRHWVVSRALQPGMRWGVVRDDEIAKDYVRVEYDLDPTNLIDYPTPPSTTWPTSWGRSSTTYCTVHDGGGGIYYYSVQANAVNPAFWSPAMTAEAGRRYRARVLLTEEYTAGGGTFQIQISWRDSADSVISTTTVFSASAAVLAATWQEVTGTAPATTDHAYIIVAYGSASGYARAYMRGFEFQEVTPAGQLQSTQYPAGTISASSRVGLINIGTAKAAEAALAAQQAYMLWHETYQGPVSGLVGTCHTIDGQQLPVELMREGDWITCLDAPAGEAGPHYITGWHLAGGELDITCGGDVAYHFNREIVEKRGASYLGAHRIWVRTGRKRVTWLSWWRRQPRQQAYYHKHHKWPKPPKKHPKFKTVNTYGWKDVPGSWM